MKPASAPSIRGLSSEEMIGFRLLVRLGVVCLMSAACGVDRVDEGSGSGEAGEKRPSWQLQAGDDAYTGDIAYVNRGDGRLYIHLVNQDSVNFALHFPEEGPGPRTVEAAFFAIGRGQDCHLVASDPPFQVTLDDGRPLKGTFTGYVGCQDDTGFEIDGSFELPGE